MQHQPLLSSRTTEGALANTKNKLLLCTKVQHKELLPLPEPAGNCHCLLCDCKHAGTALVSDKLLFDIKVCTQNMLVRPWSQHQTAIVWDCFSAHR